jgi:glycosyltransferase involved in cell wall biosynthesis
VHELGRCSDAELNDYLRHARALLLPSFVEGFGMPVIEALANGLPVIASDLSVFREIAGNTPDYLDPADGIGWRNVIANYCDPDSPQRAKQIERMANFEIPTWDQHFSRVEKFLKAGSCEVRSAV